MKTVEFKKCCFLLKKSFAEFERNVRGYKNISSAKVLTTNIYQQLQCQFL